MMVRAPQMRTRQSIRPTGRVTLGACLIGLAGLAASPASASVKASITIDARTGAVLQSFNANASRAPASLSKMMTLYLVFEALSRRRLYWNSKVTISRHAATRSPVKLYLRVGQRVRVRDLVYAVGVKSANDAAAALAEKISGSEGRFAHLMTVRARQLGMRRTVFRTASGLPARGQRTTARDMAILARSLIRHYPRYYKVFSTRYYRFGRRTLRNTNRLLHSHRSVDGMKTGYTHRARHNLVTSARRGRTRIITVVLGGSSSNARYRATRYLIAGAWGKARSVMYARKGRRGRILVASKRRVGGGYASAKAKSRAKAKARKAILIARAKSRRAAKRAIVVAAAAKKKPVAAMAQRRSSKKKVRITLASAASAATRSGSVRYVYETKRVVRYIRKPVVTWRNQHGVQVGAFYKTWRARLAVRRALKALPRKYRRQAKIQINRQKSRRRPVYRARLMGLRAGHAQRACRSLRRRGMGCAAVYGRVAVTRHKVRRTYVTVRVRRAVPVVRKVDPLIIAQRKARERKAAERKLAERKLAERRVAERRVAERKVAERKVAERRARDRMKARQLALAEDRAELKRAVEREARRLAAAKARLAGKAETTKRPTRLATKPAAKPAKKATRDIILAKKADPVRRFAGGKPAREDRTYVAKRNATDTAPRTKARIVSSPRIAWKPVSRAHWAAGGADKPRYVTSGRAQPRVQQVASRQTASSSSKAKALYAIQVGAFSEYKWAKRGLSKAQKALSGQIVQGKGTRIVERKSDKNRAIYRARIIGMSKDEANKACDILKKRSLRCLAIRSLANG